MSLSIIRTVSSIIHFIFLHRLEVSRNFKSAKVSTPYQSSRLIANKRILSFLSVYLEELGSFLQAESFFLKTQAVFKLHEFLKGLKRPQGLKGVHKL